MRIIVGLGNPGQQYENTRHNAGFMVINALVLKLGLNWKNSKKFKADIAKNESAILVKPQDFMNNSGQTVAAVLSYYIKHPLTPFDKRGKGDLHLSPLIKGGGGDYLADILTVIHDDLDIELGKYKISVDSRSAGHKGVESIINHLKTKNFRRIRIGIRTPALEKIPADKYVLMKLNAEEKKIINDLIIKITEETR